MLFRCTVTSDYVYMILGFVQCPQACGFRHRPVTASSVTVSSEKLAEDRPVEQDLGSNGGRVFDFLSIKAPAKTETSSRQL